MTLMNSTRQIPDRFIAIFNEEQVEAILKTQDFLQDNSDIHNCTLAFKEGVCKTTLLMKNGVDSLIEIKDTVDVIVTQNCIQVAVESCFVDETFVTDSLYQFNEEIVSKFK